jgi:hypothetical protein
LLAATELPVADLVVLDLIAELLRIRDFFSIAMTVCLDFEFACLATHYSYAPGVPNSGSPEYLAQLIGKQVD